MRIAVDARELCGRPTGVGRYLSELLTEWSGSSTASRHDWTLYAHKPFLSAEAPSAKAEGLPWSDRLRVLEGNGGTVWEQLTLAGALRRDRPDVLFAPGYTAPLFQPAPTVQTIHDVSFFAHPEWFGPREGFRRRLITRWSARRARIVLTDSQFSKGEIARFIGPADLRVILLGMRSVAAPAFAQSSTFAKAPADEPAVTREPLVLYVGSVFDRRRVDQLIASFDRVVDRVPGARLEIVGENRTSRPRLDLDALRAGTRHPERISIRSYVDEATLRGLYAHASVFAFLSEYEGFGLTPLEALRAGVAPVVLDTPVAREVCGPAARYVAASATADAVTDTVTDLLTSAGARAQILDQAPQVLARYDWATAAAATLAAIEEGADAR
ncbi:MAG: glycosyltransferase family 1 protein [Vicinamibacterales bacterium]